MNFADETEAANFQAAIEDKLTERRLRRERRMASKRQSQNGSTNSNSNLQTMQNNQQPQTHANPMPSNAPMPQQQPIQQVHVPAHVYYHRYVVIQGVSILIVFFFKWVGEQERIIFDVKDVGRFGHLVL